MSYKILAICAIAVITSMLIPQEGYTFPWSYDMWEQPAIQPYEQPVIYPEDSVTKDGVTVGAEERSELEQITDNPRKPTEESITHGKQLYKTYCAVCHGENAKGNGILITKGHGFYPVDLTSQSVAQRTDGFIYAYILYGGKVMMPAYGESVSSNDAWDIINYVRSLQDQPQTTNTTAEESEE